MCAESPYEYQEKKDTNDCESDFLRKYDRPDINIVFEQLKTKKKDRHTIGLFPMYVHER